VLAENALERVKKYVLRDSTGRQVAYSVRGDPNGIPTFFMHGSPGSSAGPLPNDMMLRIWGSCIVSVDRPGYGHSDPLPGRTVADGVRDVELVADALAVERFNVMGRSGGGPYALGCAALLGSRVVSVATLAGIAPPYLMDRGFTTMTADNAAKYAAATSRAGLSSLEASYMQLADGVQGEPSYLLQYLEPDLRPADRAVLAAANLRWLTRLGHRDGLRQGAAGWLADSYAATHDWGFGLDFATPTFIWSGRADGFTPPGHGETLHREIANNVLIQHDQVAHFSALTAAPPMLTVQRSFYRYNATDQPTEGQADQLAAFMQLEPTIHALRSVGNVALWHTVGHPQDEVYWL